jgi:hypothetical protein
MRKIKVFSSLIPLLIATSLFVYADDLNAIRQKLVSEYALTQPTADGRDIVTAGAVLVLKKGPLTMGDVSNSVNPPNNNIYKDGKIQKSWWDKMNSISSSLPGANAPKTRTFVPGEKMWVMKIAVKDGGAVFYLLSDPYKDTSGGDVRYTALLTFAFPKGSTPTVDQMDKMVAEVFSVQPAEPANAQAAILSQPAEAPPAPIAPPPPPPDQPAAAPKTIEVGQTKEQVVANFGQPEKIMKLRNKETYQYKDMKVIFVGGKVSDVQ